MNYPQWQARGAEAVVIGNIAQMSDGRYDVRFRLMDVLKQTQLAGFSYSISPAQARNTAERRRDAQRSTQVGAFGQRDHASSERCGATAGRSSG